MSQPLTKHEMAARGRLIQIVVGLVFVGVVAVVLLRMYRPSLSNVCDHIAELEPNPIAQRKIDSAMAEVPEASRQSSPGARCEAYFTAVRDDPRYSDDYSERSGCVLDARTLSSVAACLNK